MACVDGFALSATSPQRRVPFAVPIPVVRLPILVEIIQLFQLHRFAMPIAEENVDLSIVPLSRGGAVRGVAFGDAVERADAAAGVTDVGIGRTRRGLAAALRA